MQHAEADRADGTENRGVEQLSVVEPPIGITRGYKLVDLGLPSGLEISGKGKE